MDRAMYRIKKKYSASITIEAAMVLGVVLLTLGFVIQYAYTMHDTTTGAVILVEALEEARYCKDESISLDTFTQKGTQAGNPRIWLGEYHLELKEDNSTVSGIAEAGKWKMSIEMQKSRPAEKLRGYRLIEDIGV